MEILDIVNDKNEIIGNISREQIYKKNLCHRIVHVLVFNNKNELALQLRSNDVLYCPAHWSTSVGGHVKTGEECKEAALREYMEELGVSSKLKKLSIDYYEPKIGPSKFLYIYKTIFNESFNPDSKEVKKITFFSLGKIQEMIENKEKFHPELLYLIKKYF